MKPVNIFLISIVLLFSASCSQHDQATAPSSSTVRVDNILLLDALLAGSRVIAAGERGQIIYSDDKGGTWKRARVPVQATLTALFFIDDTHGWAAGHDSVILRTIDGGENWEQTHSAPQQEAPLLDIWFSDRTKGFAVGAYGQFYATMDGGRTWKKKSAISDDMHINSISGSAGGTIYLAGEAGTLYRSVDGGASWQRLASPYRGSFFGVLTLRSGGVLLYGLRGHLYRSDAGGANWRSLPTSDEASLFGGLEPVKGMVVLVGQDGTVLLSSDNGKTFRLKKQAGSKIFSAAVRVSDTELLLFGEAGVSRMDVQ
ncbi:MAG: hypothetical protein A2X56_13975 [Nitrospirae bacterium GWC2_57_13]|nr:MAG: hypothetical protein A2072_01060 [Nitrospirae bacterium GWC1_57_7]OGW28541.1 MAG: hypothetical protein A2X56_13975 [Nitrospirae bacterium GWC2_57_13]